MSLAMPARRLRARAGDGPGQTCLVGVATLYRRPVFADADAVAAVARVHASRWPWRDTGVLAWRLAEDEWQAVLRLGATDTLAAVVGRFKSASSRLVADRHRINGWLWGRGFRDRPLAPGDELQAVVAALLAPADRGAAPR